MRFKEMALLADSVFMERIRESDKKIIQRGLIREIIACMSFNLEEKVLLIGLLFGEDFKDE